MSTKDLERDEKSIWLNENVRGAAVLVIGVALLIGISYGAMVVLTSPDGWVARAAASGEQPAALVFAGENEAQ